MMLGLRNSIEQYVVAGASRLENWPVLVGELRTEHRGILEAIALHDSSAARKKIQSHITGYFAHIQLADHKGLPERNPT